MANNQQAQPLNLHQKMLKIADMAGVLQKTKDGYGYKYVPEEDIQAKVTAGMQKYNVLLTTSLVPDTLTVTPYHYEKLKNNKLVPVNEVIVHAEVEYTWTNAENPTEKIVNRWAYIGQMEDASQAFGAGATYGNRYYLMKSLQLATSESDPDNYRSKQQEAANYEEEKSTAELKGVIGEIISLGTMAKKAGHDFNEIYEIVAKNDNGNNNPNKITNLEVANKVKEQLQALITEKKTTKKTTSKKGENAQ